MSRSAADATRFTATSPHVYSKPSAPRSAASTTLNSSSQPRGRPFPGGKPPTGPTAAIEGETPAEKVRRLRAAYLAQKAAEVSTWDRIVVKGRAVADMAHRFTTLGLIGFTVIAGGITAFSLGDMIIYNRRKRRAYYEEQTALLKEKTAAARQAIAAGTADQDQILLLDRERVEQEAAAALKNKKSMWQSVTGMLTSGLKKEDQPTMVETESRTGTSPAVLQVDSRAASQASSSASPIMQAVEEKRREGERAMPRDSKGGPLDQMADQAANAAKAKGGWTSWMTSK